MRFAASVVVVGAMGFLSGCTLRQSPETAKNDGGQDLASENVGDGALAGNRGSGGNGGGRANSGTGGQSSPVVDGGRDLASENIGDGALAGNRGSGGNGGGRADSGTGGQGGPVVDAGADVPATQDASLGDGSSGLSLGQSCTGAALCASGNCVDGVCCDTPCVGSCSQCNLTSFVGRCTAVAAGAVAASPHAPCTKALATTCKQNGLCDGKGACQLYGNGEVCGAGTCTTATQSASTGSTCDGLGTCMLAPAQLCTPFKCKADNSACSTTCTADTDCQGQPCVNGSCGKIATGKCTAAVQCLSGNCVDGYCCDLPCSGSCQACDLAGKLGTCSVLPANQPPRGTRAACAPGTCGSHCDGASASCIFSPTTTSCGVASCTAGTAAAATSCDGKGVCVPAVTTACGMFTCGGTTCKTSCAADADCATAAAPYCSAGRCQALKPDGRACVAGTECASTFCIASLCSSGCATGTKICNGACIANAACCGGCSGATPVCTNGVCVKRPVGQACAGDTECASAHCADGVCCNLACAGQCEGCSAAGTAGTCLPVATPRSPCGGSGTCAGRCDGVQRACVFPGTTTVCAPASCTANNAIAAATCNGSGGCPPGAGRSCGAFGCSGTGCATSCPTGQAACSGACVDILSSPAHCGTTCMPCGATVPRCLSGACVACVTAADCVGANSTCGADHKCVCHQQGSLNRLGTAGFDQQSTTVSSWTPSPSATWVSDDADGCPGSGSVKLVVSADVSDFGNIHQCVGVSMATDYNFGFRYKQDANAVMICDVFLYSGTGCTGNLSLAVGEPFQTPDLASAIGWTNLGPFKFSTLSAQSAEVRCASDGGSVFIDQIYLSTGGVTF